MRTINQLQKASEILDSNFNLTIGTFSTSNFQRVYFQIELSNIHIQALLNMGVSLDFSSKKASNKRNSNEFIINAYAPMKTLNSLEKYSRDNHPYHVSMINNHQIVEAGFPLKGMRIEDGRLAYGIEFTKSEKINSHISKIEAIRKEVRKKFNRNVSNYTNRCSVKKIDY